MGGGCGGDGRHNDREEELMSSAAARGAHAQAVIYNYPDSVR